MILEQTPFQKQLETIFQKRSLKDPLQRMRASAWDRFSTIGLPTRKSEVFQYVPLRKLYGKEIIEVENQTAIEKPSNTVLTFVDGRFSEEQSNIDKLPSKIVILPLSQAIGTYGTLLNNFWEKTIRQELDPFAALNAALHKEGVFVYVPPRLVVEEPIELKFIVTQEGTVSFPRVQVFMGSQSEATFFTTMQAPKNCLINTVAEFSLDDGSRATYGQNGCTVDESTWLFDATRASLKRDCLFKSVAATNGSESVRYDYKVYLNGENSEASLNGVWKTKGSNEAHAHVLMDHQAPNCRSMQLFKGVLEDASHSSFEGKILVQQAAQKTQAFQLNNNLLLSDKAMADSKPNLEIFADDVKASHGATVGQLDNEQLFYLKTRGFSDKQARNLLTFGFCKEVVDMFPEQSIRESILKQWA